MRAQKLRSWPGRRQALVRVIPIAVTMRIRPAMSAKAVRARLGCATRDTAEKARVIPAAATNQRCSRNGVIRRHSMGVMWGDGEDRKSTRLNSSHLVISYAVF